MAHILGQVSAITSYKMALGTEMCIYMLISCQSPHIESNAYLDALRLPNSIISNVRKGFMVSGIFIHRFFHSFNIHLLNMSSEYLQARSSFGGMVVHLHTHKTSDLGLEG